MFMLRAKFARSSSKAQPSSFCVSDGTGVVLNSSETPQSLASYATKTSSLLDNFLDAAASFLEKDFPNDFQ
jgi:hypothetical protein